MELLVIVVGLALASGGKASTPGASLVQALRQCQVGFAQQAAEQLAELWGHDADGLADWLNMWGADCLRDLTLKWCDPPAYRAAMRRAWYQRQRDKALKLRYCAMLRRAELLGAAASHEPWPVLAGAGRALSVAAGRGRTVLASAAGFPAWTIRRRLHPELSTRVHHVLKLTAMPEMLTWRRRAKREAARPVLPIHNPVVQLALRLYCPPKMLARQDVPDRIKYASAISNAALAEGDRAALCHAELVEARVSGGAVATARAHSYRPPSYRYKARSKPEGTAARNSCLGLGGFDFEAWRLLLHKQEAQQRIDTFDRYPELYCLVMADMLPATLGKLAAPSVLPPTQAGIKWGEQYPELYRIPMPPAFGLRPADDIVSCTPTAFPPPIWRTSPPRPTTQMEVMVPVEEVLTGLWAMTQDRTMQAQAEHAAEMHTALAVASSCRYPDMQRRAIVEATWAMLTMEDTPWGDPTTRRDPEGPAIPMTEAELTNNIGLHMLTEMNQPTAYRQAPQREGGEPAQGSGTFRQGPWVAHISELPELDTMRSVHRMDPGMKLQLAGWFKRTLPKSKKQRAKVRQCRMARKHFCGPGIYCQDDAFQNQGVYCEAHALQQLGNGAKGKGVVK